MGDRLGLVDGFQTEGKLGSNGLEIRSDTNTGESTVEERRIEGFEVDGVIGSLVIMFKLHHWWLTIGHLDVSLGSAIGGPTVVETTRHSTIIINVTLQKSVVSCIESCERVGRHDWRAQRK